jgi:DNA repair protein RadD
VSERVPDAHQQRTDTAVREAWIAGLRAICVVVPTGGGKTYIGTRIVQGALKKGRRVAWLAHRNELCQQASASLSDSKVAHGIVQAGRPRRSNEQIQVASVQTLAAAVARYRKLLASGNPEAARRELDLFPFADIVVIDETHHVAARTWREVLGIFELLRAERDMDPELELLLGLTATPERADKSPLGDIYKHMVAMTSVAELQRTLREGLPVLVPMRVVGPGRYQKELFRKPIEGLLEFGKRSDGSLRPAIMFCGSVDEARAIAAEACARGIRAACVDGGTKDDVRKSHLAKLHAGALDLLTNVFVLTEGFDCPRVEVVAIARGCDAESTFLQMVGRGLRSCPGKRDALLIDYRGLSHVHGLVEEERAYSLSGKAIARAAERAPLRQCPACGSVFAPVPCCPTCGHDLSRLDRAQKVKLAKAVEITRDTTTPQTVKRSVFDALCREARERGHKPGWVGYRYEARFGYWPRWPIAVGGAR